MDNTLRQIVDEQIVWLGTVRNLKRYAAACGVTPRLIRRFQRQRYVSTRTLERMLEARHKGPPAQTNSW